MAVEDVDLIEPIDVTIQQLDKSETQIGSGIDGITHIQNAPVRTSIVVSAQIAYVDALQKLDPTALGFDEEVAGYLVLRTKDLKTLTQEIRRGDKITTLGKVGSGNELTVEYYLLHKIGDRASHFTAIGGFTLTRLFFADRVPTD